jgi:hypothetical protein
VRIRHNNRWMAYIRQDDSRETWVAADRVKPREVSGGG